MQGKVSPDRSAPQVYVGVDVCKDRLDVYIHPIGRALRVPNDRAGLARLVRELAGLDVVRVVMEATGKMHYVAHRALHEAGFPVAVVNPLRSRLFAEAKGALAKTDAIDARILAVLAESLAPQAKPPAPATFEELRELVHARAAAVAEATALKNRRGAATSAFLKRELNRRIVAAEGHVARLDAEIARRLAADPALAQRYEILVSIPGVGAVAAMAMIADLAELGRCSSKEAAMIAGLAPVACDSGAKQGARRIRGGRSAVRTGIYMAAVSAARCNPDLRAFYRRLRDAGKPFKLAIAAVMRKLVVLANTLIAETRHWSPQRP